MKSDPELTDETMRERVVELALTSWQEREAQVGAELMRQFERSLMLQTLDHHWRDHLSSLDHLRQGIHLRGYAQKNPKQEYKREAFELFSDMLDRIKQDVVKVVLTVQVRTQQDVQAVEEAEAVSNVKYQHADYEEALAAHGRRRRRRRRAAAAVHARRREGRPQRSVPVRSGKKYKQCHGKLGTGSAASAADAGPLHAATPPNRCCRCRASRSAPPPRRSRSGTATTCCSSCATRARSPRACSRRTASARRRSSCAASISRASTRRRGFRALVVNAGNANAGTGDAGLADAHADCVAVARLLGCAPEEVLPYSTGVIMEPLPVERIVAALPAARAARARRRLVRRRARDHDDGHRAEGRVAPRRRRRRAGDGHRHRQGRRA